MRISNGKLLLAAACAFFIILLLQPLAANAVTRTWDGGGATNNWSDAANWSGDAIPTSADDAVFNSTSAKASTIDQNFSVATVQIQSGYTATVTQSAGANLTVGGSFMQAAGTFQGGSGTVTINGTLQITGGAFQGGTGSISGAFGFQITQSGGSFSSGGSVDVTTFTLSGGTFNAPAGTMTIVADYTHTTGGTFNAGVGTVTFTGYQTFNCINQITINVNVTETFNNLTIANSFCNQRYIAAGDTLIVNNNFRISYGKIAGGRIRPLGTTTIDATNVGYGGSSIVEYIAPNQNFVINNPATAADMFPVELNAANSTLTSSGAGKINFYGMTLLDGTLNQPNAVWDFTAYPGYAQSGGIFNGSAAQLNISNGINGNILTGGTFNGGTGLINGGWGQTGGTFSTAGSMNVAGFNLSGGTFNAPLGTLDIYNGFNHTSGGTFNPRTGTVQTSALTGVYGIQFDVNSTETFNNLRFNGTNNNANHLIAAGDTLTVNGALTFSGRGVSGGSIVANGNVSYENYGAYQNATTLVKIQDAATRTITLCADAATCGGTYEATVQPTLINNPNVTVNAGLTANGSMIFGALTLQQGTFNQGAGKVSMVSLDQSGGSFNGGSYNGNTNLNTFGAFTLTGGDFNAAPTTTFTGNFTHTAATGNFNEGTGTVFFYSTFNGTNGIVDVNGNETFYNVNFRSGNGTNIAAGDTMIVGGTTTLQAGVVNGGTLDVKGDVNVPQINVGGNFQGGTAGVIFSGAVNQTFTNLDARVTFGGTWTVNKPNSSPLAENNFAQAAPTTLLLNGSVGSASLNNYPAFSVVSGNVVQTATFSHALGSLALAAGTSFVNEFGGALTLAGNLTNDGSINFNGSGSGCPQADNILIRSSVAGTQRTWSGAGIYRLIDIDLKDQNSTTRPLIVYNGTDAGNNTNFVFNGGCLSPTAGAATIGGRVLSSSGRGVSRARVLMTDADGAARYTMTNALGYYGFADVAVGQTVVIQVSGRKNGIVGLTRTVNVTGDADDINFASETRGQ